MAINLNGQPRIPQLLFCESCGGTADYFADTSPVEIVVRCTGCGRQTKTHPWASGAGEEWNRRVTSGARIVTLPELRNMEFQRADDHGNAAVWIEERSGELRAAVLSFGIDMGMPTVWEYCAEYCADAPREWTTARIEAEGYDWRLWDRRPTATDRAAPWDGPAWEEAFARRSRELTDAVLARIQAKEAERHAETSEGPGQ